MLRSLMVVALLAAIASGGVAPSIEDVAVEQTVGLTSVDRLVVDSFRVNYAGTDIDAVAVAVNNTGTDVLCDVRVSLLTLDGRTVAAAQTTATVAPGRSDVTVAFDGAHPTDAVSLVRIRVRRAVL